MKIREHHSRTRKTPKNQFWQKWGPCTPNQCYGAAFGVLRPASLYNYQKISNFKLTETTSSLS